MEQRLQKVYRGVILRFQNYFYLNFQVYGGSLDHDGDTGCFFFTGPPPEKLKYGKPRLGEVRCIWDVLVTPNLA